MDKKKTFKEKYLDGEIPFEEIDDYTFRWGMDNENMTLREYLGLNEEEEDAWVSIGEDALWDMLDGRRNNLFWKDGRITDGE